MQIPWKDSDGFSKCLDLPTWLLKGEGQAKRGRRGLCPLCCAISLVWHCCQLFRRKLKKRLLICAPSHHLGKPANESGRSELLRNLDRWQREDERKRWKHQLLLKHDQFIKVYLQGSAREPTCLQWVFISSLLFPSCDFDQLLRGHVCLRLY